VEVISYIDTRVSREQGMLWDSIALFVLSMRSGECGRKTENIAKLAKAGEKVLPRRLRQTFPAWKIDLQI